MAASADEIKELSFTANNKASINVLLMLLILLIEVVNINVVLNSSKKCFYPKCVKQECSQSFDKIWHYLLFSISSFMACKKDEMFMWLVHTTVLIHHQTQIEFYCKSCDWSNGIFLSEDTCVSYRQKTMVDNSCRAVFAYIHVNHSLHNNSLCQLFKSLWQPCIRLTLSTV